jgi:hypothetical protein
MWDINKYMTKTFYFYYVIVKSYVLVCIKFYSFVYFLHITIMSPPFSYQKIYSLTYYIKTIEN